jgi:hypothetical protein
MKCVKKKEQHILVKIIWTVTCRIMHSAVQMRHPYDRK